MLNSALTVTNKGPRLKPNTTSNTHIHPHPGHNRLETAAPSQPADNAPAIKQAKSSQKVSCQRYTQWVLPSAVFAGISADDDAVRA